MGFLALSLPHNPEPYVTLVRTENVESDNQRIEKKWSYIIVVIVCHSLTQFTYSIWMYLVPAFCMILPLFLQSSPVRSWWRFHQGWGLAWEKNLTKRRKTFDMRRSYLSKQPQFQQFLSPKSLSVLSSFVLLHLTPIWDMSTRQHP